MVIFVVWIVSIPLKQKNKLKSHEQCCKTKHFCNVIMTSEDTKI